MLLPYWRAALAEASLLHLEVSAESKQIAINSDGDAWRVTTAEPDVNSWVSAQFAASKNKKSKKIPIVLIAARLSELSSHGVKRGAGDIHKGLTVLCIPCLLDTSGGLWPDPERHPWIPRDLLEPTLNPVSIGQLESYDKFVSGLPDKAASFDDTLRIASELFLAVTEAGLPLLPYGFGSDEIPPVFALNGYELVSGWHGIPYEPPVVAKHPIKLYDQIIDVNGKGEIILPLLDSLISTVDRPSRRPLVTQDSEQWHTNTVGHINREHPLSPSQREVMVELARLDPGQVLSVNGPPGTGKTTLIQSVVAQMWIDAALKELECPLIVVTSTNTKAVENVLDSFAKICAETGHKRWHPYPGGFGLFLASESRESKHPTCAGKNNPYSEYETSDAIESAEKYFLDQASDLFKQRQDSVAEAVKALHGRLQCLAQKLKDIIAARYDVYRATGQGTTDGAATSCNQLLAHYQSQIDSEQSLVRTADLELLACKDEEKEVESDYETTWNVISRAEKGWNAYLANSPLWLDLLSFLPSIRQRRIAQDRCFLLTNPLMADRRHRDDGIQQHFDGLRKAAMERKSSAMILLAERRSIIENRKSVSLERRNAAVRVWSKIDNAFRHWQDILKDGCDTMLDVSLDGLNDRLDIELRAPMFCVADWYWSGKWLMEMKSRLKTNEFDTKGRVKLEAKYRRFAKLSPCLVSNFHMAPSFFMAWQGESMPFWNTIDLLIVDEAGQVSPDIGAVMFALAKRALVVGDTHQIEPVWNNCEETDRTNAAKFGLTSSPDDPRYDMLSEAGYTSASGNLMHIANRSCPIQKYDDMRGLMLTEHRRCVPELVNYCNKLIYSGRLEPKRQRIETVDRILPAFGYLNVSSQDKKIGKSRQNHEEAMAIVAWLKTNRGKIEKHYADKKSDVATPLWKIVGVVTPFETQARVIEQLLGKEMPDLTHKDSRLTVGTVHAFQGAERAIVIFSPTYGTSFTGRAFLTRGQTC